jgi:hypothetical protein
MVFPWHGRGGVGHKAAFANACVTEQSALNHQQRRQIAPNSLLRRESRIMNVMDAQAKYNKLYNEPTTRTKKKQDQQRAQPHSTPHSWSATEACTFCVMNYVVLIGNTFKQYMCKRVECITYTTISKQQIFNCYV